MEARSMRRSWPERGHFERIKRAKAIVATIPLRLDQPCKVLRQRIYYPNPISSTLFSWISQDRLLHTRYNHYRPSFWRRLRLPRRARLRKRRGPVKRVSHEICHVKSSEGGSGPLRIHEDLTLPSHAIITRRLRVELKLLGFLLLAFPLGCSRGWYGCQDGLAERILAPPNADALEKLSMPRRYCSAAERTRLPNRGQ